MNVILHMVHSPFEVIKSSVKMIKMIIDVGFNDRESIKESTYPFGFIFHALRLRGSCSLSWRGKRRRRRSLNLFFFKSNIFKTYIAYEVNVFHILIMFPFNGFLILPHKQVIHLLELIEISNEFFIKKRIRSWDPLTLSLINQILHCNQRPKATSSLFKRQLRR